MLEFVRGGGCCRVSAGWRVGWLGLGGGCGNGQWVIDQGVSVILLSRLGRWVLLSPVGNGLWYYELCRVWSSGLSRVSRCSSAVACFWKGRRYVQCGMIPIYRQSLTCHFALRRGFSRFVRNSAPTRDSLAFVVARGLKAEELSRRILDPMVNLTRLRSPSFVCRSEPK